MPLIVKPISANLVKDFDLLGKSVFNYHYTGPLRHYFRWKLKAKVKNMQWRRKKAHLDRYVSIQF